VSFSASVHDGAASPAVLTGVLRVTPAQTGAWLTWVTVTLTVAVLESRLPSLAL
jgi:hypothetical protein